MKYQHHIWYVIFVNLIRVGHKKAIAFSIPYLKTINCERFNYLNLSSKVSCQSSTVNWYVLLQCNSYTFVLWYGKFQSAIYMFRLRLHPKSKNLFITFFNTKLMFYGYPNAKSLSPSSSGRLIKLIRSCLIPCYVTCQNEITIDTTEHVF